MEQPIVVSSFRGTGPLNAGTAGSGDTTLRFTGGDAAVSDIVLPETTAEVFAAIRGAEAALTTLVNSVAIVNSTTQPAFTSATPATGAHASGVAVAIVGTGFAAGAKVYFGGVLCTSIVVVSSTSITCVSPTTLTAATYDIAIINPNSKAAFSANGWIAS